jgi:three-Cys-motif partner protein
VASLCNMGSPDSEHLFELAEIVQVARREGATSELTTALKLDREASLVPAPDGLWARKVCLHSRDKAHYTHYYADIVGTAMKTAFPGPLVWIELFSGPGMLYVKDTDKFEPGSPIEALDIRDPFDTYVFADLSPDCTDSLKRRVENRAEVISDNANSPALHDRILSLVPRNALVVLYADPAGLDLDFSTVKFFADRYPHLDLLLNFPVPGIDRALSAGQEAKAARVLNHPSPVELIGPGSGRPGTVSVREYYERQLRGLGYTEFPPAQVIRLHGKNAPLYDLMLASRNPRAKQFFMEAVRRSPGGQHALF